MHTSDLARSVLDLTRQLVAIDSVNPSLVPGAAGEAEIAAFVANRLDAAGFTITLVGSAARPSVVATRDGSTPGRTVVLNGHLDTVGVDGMDDPFTARLDGVRLLGRGTSDMKGGVAGLIVAAEHLARLDVPGRLALVLVADEEDGSVGATAVLDQFADASGYDLRSADVCLIAEPTWLDLAVAHRGYEVVRVGIRGRAAHSSQPDEGRDVMQPLGRLLVGIGQRDAAMRAAPSHPLLSHGSLMATVARAGSAPFMVAADAELIVERRTLPGESSTVGLEEVRALVAETEDQPDVTWAIEPVISREAWQADDSGPAAELMSLLEVSLPASAALPARTGAPYWMESALWQHAGVPTVVCGPAGGGLHAVDEWVDVTQLQQFPVAVADAVGRFLG